MCVRGWLFGNRSLYTERQQEPFDPIGRVALRSCFGPLSLSTAAKWSHKSHKCCVLLEDHMSGIFKSWWRVQDSSGKISCCFLQRKVRPYELTLVFRELPI